MKTESAFLFALVICTTAFSFTANAQDYPIYLLDRDNSAPQFVIQFPKQVQNKISKSNSNFRTRHQAQSIEEVKSILQNVLRGNEGGHGGDTYAEEFFTLGQGISESLFKVKDFFGKQTNVTANEFANAVNKEVRIVSSDKEDVVLNGAEVEAINFPELKVILISRDFWRQKTLPQKIKLVLHEYFGILGIERDNYKESTQRSILSLVQSLTKKIQTNPVYADMQVNLFYGQARDVVSFSSIDVCDASSMSFSKALLSSQQQAQAQCKISGRSECQLINTTVTPKISKIYAGLRYCEILTIIK